jgi:1-acyl-sn-glycerol-3-phosphate acyltransferase
MGKSEIPVVEETVTRSQLRAEIDRLIERLEERQPAFDPPPFALAGLIQLLEQSIRYFAPDARLEMLHRFRQQVEDGTFEMDTLRGAWYLAQYTLEMQADIVKRHLQGDYETDEWGLDWELLELIRPLLDFTYNYYFRVQASDVTQIPDYGRSLLVTNHTGPLPWDMAMLVTAVLTEHPNQRLPRGLFPGWLAPIPFVAPLLERLGQVMANPDNTRRLLEQEELVAVFTGESGGLLQLLQGPQVNSIGRNDFIKAALAHQTPIIPVAINGAEPCTNSRPQASGRGSATFPSSLHLPWLGLLGLIPLPARWKIAFGPPLDFSHYGQAGADNVLLVSRLGDQVRDTIQTLARCHGQTEQTSR